MAFQNIHFIKCDYPFFREFDKNNISPMFRKKINIPDLKNVKMRICGLGYAHCYLNGKKITEDLFISPISNYNKTLWYNEYDV